jgi:hypothetical protein
MLLVGITLREPKWCGEYILSDYVIFHLPASKKASFNVLSVELIDPWAKKSLLPQGFFLR